MFRAWEAGEVQTAMELQQRALRIFDAAHGNNHPICYGIMKWRGVDCGVPLLPVLPPDPEVMKTVIRDMEALDMMKEAREFEAGL